MHGDPLGTNPTSDNARDPATASDDPVSDDPVSDDTAPDDAVGDDTLDDVLPEGTEPPEGPTVGLP